MDLKANDNITILIAWKGWKNYNQNNEYIIKTRTIINEFDKAAIVGSRENFRTIIRMEIPHRELENYAEMADDEHAYDFSALYRLIARFKADNDVKAIYVEMSDYERAGREFSYESILYNVMEYDENGKPTLIRLYPYFMDK